LLKIAFTVLAWKYQMYLPFKACDFIKCRI